MDNQFLRARIKLTAYYTIGVAMILIILSFVVYGLFTKDLSGTETDADGDKAIVITQVINKAQSSLRLVLVSTDISIMLVAIVSSYYLAKKTLEPIERAQIRQNKFVADSAHELRTPLTVMKTGVELVLSAERNKEDYKKLAEDLLEEINFLSETTNDMLFLAGSDDNKGITLEPVALDKLAQKQIEILRPYAEKKKVTLEKKIEDNLIIKGNKGHLKRLIVNLLKNAIDYNIPNGHVTLLLQKKDSQVFLHISDSGIGISDTDKQHIFDRFYKADQARTQKTSGAGLGLSIVKEIVESHGGSITIESKLGQGTEILVLLPLYSTSN